MNAGGRSSSRDQVGCQKNLVHPGINGFVVPAGNVAALAVSLRTVLTDQNKALVMGAESLRIIADHSFEQDVSGLRAALHALLPGFPGQPQGT